MRGYNIENTYEDIDQSLYSRVILGGENRTQSNFFGNHLGEFNSVGEVIDRVDTNMNAPGMHCNEFIVNAIRFKETILDREVREHLLKTAYFFFRLNDRDYVVYPIHLMSNYYYFLEKELKKPIVISPFMSFTVQLHMKSYPVQFQLTCELVGVMKRSN